MERRDPQQIAPSSRTSDLRLIGRQLRWARRRAGLTQHDLAAAVGMPQPSVARIERGTVSPRTSTLAVLLVGTGYRLALEPVDPPVDRDAIRQRLAMSIPRRTRLAIGPDAKDPTRTPIRALRRLRRFAVPFVLIGDLAEVAHGAPIKVSRPITIVHASTDEARERLALALADARPDSVEPVTESAAGDTYEVLARNAVPLPVDAGMLVPVAALEDLIRIRRVGRSEPDGDAAATLRAIAEMA